jgi:transposase InsO family protein
LTTTSSLSAQVPTYRVLKAAGRLDRKNVTPSKKGTGFIQPTKNHQEWHVDISYINAGGTFFFLISVLDGFSRYIVHWELSETMKELDVELVIAKATEKHPGVAPRIISDNGPQFIAKTPSDMLAGKQKEIHKARDRKREEAREARSKIRAQQAAARYAERSRP